jgi:hypothetical protein
LSLPAATSSRRAASTITKVPPTNSLRCCLPNTTRLTKAQADHSQEPRMLPAYPFHSLSINNTLEEHPFIHIPQVQRVLRRKQKSRAISKAARYANGAQLVCLLQSFVFQGGTCSPGQYH